MGLDKYSVIVSPEMTLAEHMTLETALILVKALFEKYWQDDWGTGYTIIKEKKNDNAND